MKRFQKALAISAAFLCFSGAASMVNALCIDPGEDGNWHNVDNNTRSITRANLLFLCQDQILNGQPWPPGDPWTFKL